MTDPLAVFYTWPLKIRRKGGQTAKGSTFEPEVTVLSRIRMVSQLATDADGREVMSIATASMAADTPHIPVGSKVTLPAELGGAEATVEIAGLHDTKIPGMPAYYQVSLV
ncbi:hypothetical protein [Williamsia sp. D3]|uniref:hypothetical protein n=1 Tax=Williamsia sp. D3 TaxID=1313067 RepID=UPI0003D2D4B3|nr:hypothetical protein [Williamsia sp. D3]ETD31523.1 hypothetical protein W823_19265 [Williamsia sp. D3]